MDKDAGSESEVVMLFDLKAINVRPLLQGNYGDYFVIRSLISPILLEVFVSSLTVTFHCLSEVLWLLLHVSSDIFCGYLNLSVPPLTGRTPEVLDSLKASSLEFWIIVL